MESYRVKRFFWQVMTGFTTLLLIGVLALLMSSCNKFEIAKKKYAKDVVDTTYQTITTVAPRDSVVLHTRTDTTRIFLTEKQGRATVYLQRDPNVTTVRAVCDTVVITKKVPYYIKKQEWGVDPAWQKRAERRMGVIWVLVAIILIGLLAWLFVYRLQLSVTKRDKPADNGTVSG